MAARSSSIEIFFSYSHLDEELRQRLDAHLSGIWRSGVARNWHDRKIGAGQQWAHEIDEHLNSAQIILLLVSADFLASDYCYGIEMTRALERHANGDARVIPIILRHVDWKHAPFSALQSLPPGGKPVTAWRDQDEALTKTAKAIRDVVDELLKGESDETPPVLTLRRRTYRPGPRTWIAIAVTIALAIAGFRYRTRLLVPQQASEAAPAISEQVRANLSFAAGWSVALAGQSSGGEPARMFDHALSNLGLEGDQLRDLDRRYDLVSSAARDGTLRYGDFETAKSLLLTRTGERLNELYGPRSAAMAVFGHDVGALRLLLRYWREAEEDGDVVATARDRVVSLQRSVNSVDVPAALAQQLHDLRASELSNERYRRAAERVLDETMGHFDMPSP